MNPGLDLLGYNPDEKPFALLEEFVHFLTRLGQDLTLLFVNIFSFKLSLTTISN